jgi:hypothetical protein
LPQNGVLYSGSTQITSTSTGLNNGTSLTYLGNNLFWGLDSFGFTVRDTAGSFSSESIVSINVTHVNHPPNVFTSSQTVTTLENVPITVTQISASDPDGDTVYIKIYSAPTAGKLTTTSGADLQYPAMIASPFDFIFVPATNAYGNAYAFVDIYAYDGTVNSTGYIHLEIDVTHVNQPPVAGTVNVGLNEVTPSTIAGITITLPATDPDNNNTQIYAVIVSLPDATYGTLSDTTGVAIAVGQTVTSRVVVFTPVPYTFGSTQFTWQAIDTSQAYSANTATIPISITHVNHAPSSSDVAVQVDRGVPITVQLFATDPDAIDSFSYSLGNSSNIPSNLVAADGTTITASTITFATGILNTPTRIFSTSVTYTPPATSAASASFSFIVTDNYTIPASSNPASTLTFNVAPDNDPAATPITMTVQQDGVSPAGVLNGTDVDPADANTLTVVIDQLPQNGNGVLMYNGMNLTAPVSPAILSLPQGASVYYTTNARGSDSFSFHVVDLLGVASASITVPITINPTNHPPTASYSGDTITQENVNVTITQISASDPDAGDTVQVIITVLPSSGLLMQYDGTPITETQTAVTNPSYWLSYAPAIDGYGTPYDSFSFYATDGSLNSTTMIGTIDVSHVNQPPVAIPGTTQALENDPPVTLTLNVSDVDTPLSSVSIYLTTLPDNSIGTLYSGGSPVTLNQLIPSRQLTLVLVQYAHGNTSFTFSANDGSLNSAAGAVQTISIGHVNQPPTISASTPINVARGATGTITLQALDPDYPESFTLSVASYSANGGTFSYAGTAFTQISATTPFALATGVPKSLSGNSFSVNYTAPTSMYGDNFDQVALYISDGAGASSGNIVVSVNLLLGSAPTANPAGPITFLEESTSAVVTLSGNDADAADNSTLRFVITVLPTKATLVQKGVNGAADVDVTVAGTIITGSQVNFLLFIYIIYVSIYSYLGVLAR